jgi:F420-non-reducing hydrogenase iron-sulfur subunit
MPHPLEMGADKKERIMMHDQPFKIYVFSCVTSYDQTEVMQSINRQGGEIKLITMPCSGKLDILYLTKAFETGADGVAVMMCKEGECRYLEGNMRARKRAEAVEQLLEETGLGQGRIAVIQMNAGGIKQAIREVEDFCLRIKAILKSDRTPAIQQAENR